MAERTAWKHVVAEIHRMGGWYADQRTVDALRPVIDRYAAASGYVSPAGPTTFSSSPQITLDDVPDEVREQLTLDIRARLADEIAGLRKRLEVAEQARDNFQAESHNKDNRITVLEETRQTWMTKTQELDAKREALLAENSQLDHQVNKLSDALRVRLDECNELKAERNRLLKEGAHTCTEECVVLETIDPGSVLDQALAAAERAEKAAEGVLKALRAAEPGSYRVSSEGRVWVLVGQLDDSAEPEGWAAVAEPDRPLLAGTELTEPEHIEPVTVPERTCKRCGETKPLEGGWRRDATKPGGYRFPCASCSRAMDQARDTAHRERIREAAEAATAHLPIPAGMVVPEGMKRCGTCEHVKPLVEFAKDSSKADGLRYQCRKCRNALVVRTTPNSQLTLTEKTCNECAETKPVDAFSKDAKSSGGVKGKCKDCCARRDAQRKRDRSKK